MEHLSEAEVMALGYPRAADAINDALAAGFDPSEDPARIQTDTSQGAILMMPSEAGGAAGVKVLTLAPGNPARGRPKIQGHYLLFDGATLSPAALLDGAALTSLRTPALSVAAARPFLSQVPPRPTDALSGSGADDDANASAGSSAGSPGAPVVTIFGAGPQGVGHAAALRAEFASVGREVGPITFVVRNPEACDDSVRSAGSVVASGSPEASAALSAADVVVCATGSSEPLFSADDVRSGALVIALGSHTPGARELPAELLGRCTVVVEDRNAALREAGDVIQAIAEGAISADDLIEMKDLVDPQKWSQIPPLSERSVVVKTVGMGWQDLVVAQAVLGAGS